MAKQSVDDKLGVNRFLPDTAWSHIEINETCKDEAALRRLVAICPANLYRLESGNRLTYSHEGCLECGACRVLSGGVGVKSWNHPEGGMGIEYRMG